MERKRDSTLSTWFRSHNLFEDTAKPQFPGYGITGNCDLGNRDIFAKASHRRAEAKRMGKEGACRHTTHSWSNKPWFKSQRLWHLNWALRNKPWRRRNTYQSGEQVTSCTQTPALFSNIVPILLTLEIARKTTFIRNKNTKCSSYTSTLEQACSTAGMGKLWPSSC